MQRMKLNVGLLAIELSKPEEEIEHEILENARRLMRCGKLRRVPRPALLKKLVPSVLVRDYQRLIIRYGRRISQLFFSITRVCVCVCGGGGGGGK